MKVLLLNNADQQSGAAKASLRLLEGLGSAGQDAQMLVQKKLTDYASVIGPQSAFGKAFGIFRPHIEGLLLKSYPRRGPYLFSPANLPGNIVSRVKKHPVDLIHLHWITGGFLRIEDLQKFSRPLVWTMHDSWPFTGGCHIPFECTRYRDRCGRCPYLGSNREKDLSRRVLGRKIKAWRDLDLTLVSPSRWLAEAAGASSLFRGRRIEVIPNGIDCSVYRPLDKRQARKILNLPPDKRLLLFGAFDSTNDRNKGFDLLLSALSRFTSALKGCDVELLVFGATGPGLEAERDLGLPIHYVGRLQDDISLSLLYSAADLFVCPSRQENLPNTVVEAMACGTPVVAFDQGGLPDLIDHRQSGYLAKPYEVDDLVTGMRWVLESNDRYRMLADNAVEKIVGTCSLEKVVERHMSLYQELVSP